MLKVILHTQTIKKIEVNEIMQLFLINQLAAVFEFQTERTIEIIKRVVAKIKIKKVKTREIMLETCVILWAFLLISMLILYSFFFFI